MLDQILRWVETTPPTSDLIEAFRCCLQVLEARNNLRSLLDNKQIQLPETKANPPHSNPPKNNQDLAPNTVRITPDRVKTSSVISILNNINLNTYIRQEDKEKKVQARAIFDLFSKSRIEVTLWSNQLASITQLSESRLVELFQTESLAFQKEHFRQYLGKPFFITLRPELFNYHLKYSALACRLMEWKEVFQTPIN